MTRVFEMITVAGTDAGEKAGVAIGIGVKIGGKETLCPVTRVCNSMEGLEMEVKSLKDNLSDILAGAKSVIEGASSEAVVEFRPEMSPEEIWTILSSIKDENLFVETFNKMDDHRRREVANYILSGCNIFSGKGAVFSSRYDNDSGLIE